MNNPFLRGDRVAVYERMRSEGIVQDVREDLVIVEVVDPAEVTRKKPTRDGSTDLVNSEPVGTRLDVHYKQCRLMKRVPPRALWVWWNDNGPQDIQVNDPRNPDYVVMVQSPDGHVPVEEVLVEDK